jgi:murein DD-endopeptidase MepM/ murein hydrolase activator NlpD
LKNIIKNPKKSDKNRLKKDKIVSLIEYIEYIIEHRLFKPVAISLITSMILFYGFEYGYNLIADYRESALQKLKTTPIKINISRQGKNFNINEEEVAEYRIKAGDTMLKVLLDTGVDEQDIFMILDSVKKVFNPQSISVGDNITMKYAVKVGYNSNQLEKNLPPVRKIIINSLNISISPDEQILISRQNNGEYESKKITLKLLRYVSRYFGTLKNGLFVDGIDAGVSPNTMMNMINLYSYDVDFQREIRSGNKFEILVESFYTEDGKKVRDGNVLFSSLTLSNRVIDVYMYKIDGRTEYFDARGNSMRKSLLRTPINGARVSSGFGLRRHPILGYSKMHKGIDFAASKGTPILAAGNGTIVYFGRRGSYGNYVKIKHNSEYSTAYGHASRFNKKLHVGSKVKQGEVVAYVGSTGGATGPHLHFELIYKGSQINPAKVKATSGLKLTGTKLAGFKADKAEIDRYRKNIPNQIKK